MYLEMAIEMLVDAREHILNAEAPLAADGCRHVPAYILEAVHVLYMRESDLRNQWAKEQR